MSIISFKKIIAGLGIVTIVGSPTTIVVTDFVSNKQIHQRTMSNVEMVTNAINATQYELVVDLNSNINNLKKEINSDFMKEKLAVWIQKIFRDNFFSLNKITKENGTEITQLDLNRPGIFNTKIKYNYGHKKNQVTNLRIEVATMRTSLSSIFTNFQFFDNKDISGFLDINDLTVISRQVLARVSGSARELDQIGLTFTNRTSNSIVLKAKSNSKIYRGEVRLTWNLKLFEIHGFDEYGSNIPWIIKGLKGFFYLDKNDNKVKFFDYQEYTNSKRNAIHHVFSEYHKFIFINKKVQHFTFIGKENAGTNGRRFGTFDFNQGMKVIFYSPEPDRVRVFNRNTGTWTGFTKSTEFEINAIGEFKQVS